MKQLMIFCGILALAGCDDSRMYLGPNAHSVSGGSAGFTQGNPAGSSGLLGGSGGVGNSGGTEVGGAVSLAGAAGEVTIHGLELGGLEGLSVDIGEGWDIGGKNACSDIHPVDFTLDLDQKTLTHDRCVISIDGVTASTVSESRPLTDAQVTAAMMMLERISLDYGSNCYNDGAGVKLTLKFDDRQEDYEADYYAGCPGFPMSGVVYVANLDLLKDFLNATWGLPSIPQEYDKLIMEAPPRSPVMETWALECDTFYITRFTLDFAAKALTMDRCNKALTVGAPSTGPASVSTYSKSLDDSALTYVRTMVSELKLGAARDCGDLAAEVTSAWLNNASKPTVTSLVDGRAACPGQTERYGSYVVNLDDVYWTLNQYFDPLL